EETKTINRNPIDMVALGNIDPYQKMVENNILPIVEQDVMKNSLPYLRTRKEYKDWISWAPFVIAPESESIGVGTGAMEERVQYYGYNLLGNPMYLSNNDN